GPSLTVNGTNVTLALQVNGNVSLNGSVLLNGNVSVGNSAFSGQSLTTPTLFPSTVRAPSAIFGNQPLISVPTGEFPGSQPLLGLNTYFAEACGCGAATETDVTNYITWMAKNGLVAAGWNSLIIDETWQNRTRDADGNLFWDTNRYPDGIPFVCRYAHSNGISVLVYFQALIFTSAG